MEVGESGFHRLDLASSACVNVILDLRGQRLETLPQFELIEQRDGKRAVAAMSAALTAGK
jgi:hypothetical protein